MGRLSELTSSSLAEVRRISKPTVLRYTEVGSLSELTVLRRPEVRRNSEPTFGLNAESAECDAKVAEGEATKRGSDEAAVSEVK